MDTIHAVITNVLISSNGTIYIDVNKNIPYYNDDRSVKFTKRLRVDGKLKDYISHILPRHGICGLAFKVHGLNVEIELGPNLEYRVTSKELDTRIYNARRAMTLE